jgi:hypothetical protein
MRRYIAFLNYHRTDLNKSQYIPLFDSEFISPGEAAKYLRTKVDNPLMNAKYDVNSVERNLKRHGFCDDTHYRNYDKYEIFTYVIIDWNLCISDSFNEDHLKYWRKKAESIIREFKIKAILDD